MKTVVVKGSGGGGLGDSIRVVLTAILYARLTHRALFVDWRHGLLGEAGVNAFDDLFRLEGVASVSAIPETDSVHPPAWRSRTERSFNDIYTEDAVSAWDRSAAIATYSFDLSKTDYPEEVLLMWDFDQLSRIRPHLPPEVGHMSSTQILGQVWKTNLRPSPTVTDLVQDFWQHSVRTPAIGVHVRMTDEYAANKDSLDLSRYLEAVDSITTRHPEASIFLATDNSDCQRVVMERYDHVVVRPKWFGMPGQPLHLGSDCPDRFQATLDALVELLLLSKCDYLVRPRDSSFSMVSGILGHPHGIQEILVTARPSLASRIRNRLQRRP